MPRCAVGVDNGEVSNGPGNSWPLVEFKLKYNARSHNWRLGHYQVVAWIEELVGVIYTGREKVVAFQRLLILRAASFNLVNSDLFGKVSHSDLESSVIDTPPLGACG